MLEPYIEAYTPGLLHNFNQWVDTYMVPFGKTLGIDPGKTNSYKSLLYSLYAQSVVSLSVCFITQLEEHGQGTSTQSLWVPYSN